MDKEDVKYVYITEYYSVIKKNEISPFVTTWMCLEGTALGEINERMTNTLFCLYMNLKKRKTEQLCGSGTAPFSHWDSV